MDKGRDKAAEILKDGDVINQKFSALIVREASCTLKKESSRCMKCLIAKSSEAEKQQDKQICTVP